MSKWILRLAFAAELYNAFAINVYQFLENNSPSAFIKAKSSLFTATVTTLFLRNANSANFVFVLEKGET